MTKARRGTEYRAHAHNRLLGRTWYVVLDALECVFKKVEGDGRRGRCSLSNVWVCACACACVGVMRVFM